MVVLLLGGVGCFGSSVVRGRWVGINKGRVGCVCFLESRDICFRGHRGGNERAAGPFLCLSMSLCLKENGNKD